MKAGPVLTGSSTSLNSSTITTDLTGNNFSFYHLNIQSLLPKLDIVRIELSSDDVISFTESWPNPHYDEVNSSTPTINPYAATDNTVQAGASYYIIKATYILKNGLTYRQTGLNVYGLNFTTKEKLSYLVLFTDP